MGPHPILFALNMIIDAYVFIVFAGVILSLLIHFKIANRFNPLTQQIGVFINQLTEPAYRLIRKYLPNTQLVIMLQPIILIIALRIVQYTINYYWPL